MSLNLNLGSWEIVSIFDDAIDRSEDKEGHEVSDLAGYIQNNHRDWEQYLVMKEGKKPTVFEIESLTLLQREIVNEGMVLTYSESGASMDAYDGKRYAIAFSLCVKGWRNMELEFSRTKGRLSDDCMEILGQVAHRTVFEIGKIILDGSILQADAKN